MGNCHGKSHGKVTVGAQEEIATQINQQKSQVIAPLEVQKVPNHIHLVEN